MLYGSLFVIGAIFLFLTLLVHGLLPTRSNINDKNLISQTWSLFIGYVCIAIAQLSINKLPQNICILLGKVFALKNFLHTNFIAKQVLQIKKKKIKQNKISLKKFQVVKNCFRLKKFFSTYKQVFNLSCFE